MKTVLLAFLLAPLVLLAAAPNADKPFAAGGAVSLTLDGGAYEIRPAADNHVRVTMSGNLGNAVAEVTTSGSRADVTVKDTPRRGNFHAVIEIPRMSDVTLRLNAGELTLLGITGSKDISATAGDLTIEAGNAADYASVDASVKVGDLSGGPFGNARGEFVSKTLAWKGSGTHKLRASLGAGELKIR